MPSTILGEIESRLPLLSQDELRLLADTVTRHLQGNGYHDASFEASLEAMARDPQIQAEIKAINAEFACTDMDGLEGL